MNEQLYLQALIDYEQAIANLPPERAEAKDAQARAYQTLITKIKEAIKNEATKGH